MPNEMSRRDFVKDAILASAGAAIGLSLEEQVLLAQVQGKEEPKGAPPAKRKPAQTSPAAAKDALPMGKIGDLKMTRLILGGNLIGGWAHSRDLLYVSDLLKHYFTDEKILETLQIAESHGINTINTHPNAGPVINRYWKERGGKIQWMVQGFPTEEDHFASIKESIDAGADAIHIQGNVADVLVKQGKMDLIARALDLIKLNGLPAGVAGHSLNVPIACEKAGLKVDFYVKTLHTNNYFSARRSDQGEDVVGNTADNFWCVNAEETIAFMKKVEKPWIAFKVMAAGAIPPRSAFRHAFENGADFVLAGMFDFQIAEDVKIAREVLSKLSRSRPWRA